MLINLERARGLMKQFGVDVLIATTPENVLYCADYAPWQAWTYRGNTPKKGTQAYAIIPRDEGTPPAIIPAGTNYNTFVYAAQFPSWIEDFYPYAPPGVWPGEIPDVPHFSEPGTPPEAILLHDLTNRFKSRASKTSGEALVRALRDRGLVRGVAALDSFGFSPTADEYLRRELPNLKLKQGAEFFRLIRAVKTADEVHNLRRAAEINERAFQRMIGGIEVGKRTSDLAIEHRTVCASEGAIPSFINVSAAGHPAVLWEPGEYVLRPGDVLWMDGGCSYHHYHSDTGMSCVIGEPSVRMRETFAAVQAGMEAGINACRPGVPSSTIEAAMKGVMKDHGSANPMAYGHGIGIEEREFPIIQSPFPEFNDEILIGSSDLAMETNMVVCLEINAWEWGVGGIKSEQTVIVTPSGNETICRQDRILAVKR